MVSITDVLRRFKQNWTEELSPTAIAQACSDAGMKWYDSTLNPIVTIQIFFLQVLHGNTAIEHLSHLTGRCVHGSRLLQGQNADRTRSILPAARAVRIGQLQQQTFETGRWLGHRVFHLDGSSFSMPDTAELQAHFGQSGAQKPGCGFPTAHWLAMLARWNGHDHQDAGLATANSRHVQNR